MAQNLIARALAPQLGPQPDRYINGVLSPGVWDLAGDHFKVVEQAAPGMSVRAGSGAAGDMAVVEGAAALSGRYIIQNPDPWIGSGDAELSIGNGDPGDPRIDLVVLRLYDDEMDSSGLTVPRAEVIPGTPASSPAVPATPDGAIALASILVGINESDSIENADITDLRAQSAPDGPLGIATPVVSKAVVLSSDTASALSTVEQWGTETVTFDDPGHAVTIDAKLVGRFRYNQSAESRRVGTVYIEISLDGGGSWDRSAGVVSEVSGGLQRGTAMADLHVVSGTPTGQIRVRAMIEQALGTAGDADFTLGKLTAQQMRA